MHQALSIRKTMVVVVRIIDATDYIHIYTVHLLQPIQYYLTKD
jgi:hypothetical protein